LPCLASRSNLIPLAMDKPTFSRLELSHLVR
jgi:hypothetical protein